MDDHGKENTLTSETITKEAITGEILALNCAGSRAYARPVRLDHAYRARQLRPGSHEGVVRRGAWLDIPAVLSDAGRRRVPFVCVLRQGRWRDSQDQSVRAAGQHLLRPRPRRAGGLRKSAPRRGC